MLLKTSTVTAHQVQISPLKTVILRQVNIMKHSFQRFHLKKNADAMYN